MPTTEAQSQRQKKAGKQAPKRPKASSSEAVWIKTDALIPDPANARAHDPEQIEKLRASVRMFGQVWPILARREDKMIRAHHGLWEALKAEGYDEVKVIFADGLTDEQQRAFAIADNRLAEISEWDKTALKDELAAIMDLGFDMDAVGYAQEELDRLLALETGSFKNLDENLPTNHECPMCHYKWAE